MTIAVDKKWFQSRWKKRGLTLRKTANLVGMDPSALSRTLNGERKMKLTEVGKIATVLDVTPAEVLKHMEPGLEAADHRANDTVRISDHPAFGFMKGLIKFEEGFDPAGPYDDEAWDEGYLGVDRL